MLSDYITELNESHIHEPMSGSYRQINGDTEFAVCECGLNIVQYEFGISERYLVRWFAPELTDRRFGYLATVL